MLEAVQRKRFKKRDYSPYSVKTMLGNKTYTLGFLGFTSVWNVLLTEPELPLQNTIHR